MIDRLINDNSSAYCRFVIKVNIPASVAILPSNLESRIKLRHQELTAARSLILKDLPFQLKTP